MNRALIKTYYRLKPLVPRRVQLLMRRCVALAHRHMNGHCWPINAGAGNPPESWTGWPDGKQFAVVLTHDVDTRSGHDRCLDLMELEKRAAFRSSFNFVGGQYDVCTALRRCLVEQGFEVGVHGWIHNASLYDSREEFQRQAAQINDCLTKWGSVGFRSPCMYHNLEWLRDLSISYDASTFDTDPFEPQSDGTVTIFPFFVPGENGRSGFVELPYTLPQDFTLFILLRENNIDIWKRKLDWIAENGGMALLITHPDYMSFRGKLRGLEEYPAAHYEDLLEYVKLRYQGAYWHPLPMEMARFWRGAFDVDNNTVERYGPFAPAADETVARAIFGRKP